MTTIWPRPRSIWWYRTAGQIPSAEFGRAEAAMRAMKEQTSKRKDSPDVRDWIAETGAWVGRADFSATTAAKSTKFVNRPTFREVVFQGLVGPTSPNPACRGK